MTLSFESRGALQVEVTRDLPITLDLHWRLGAIGLISAGPRRRGVAGADALIRRATEAIQHIAALLPSRPPAGDE